MLCAVGASAWIISTPVSKSPDWSEYSKTNVYVNRVIEEDYTADGFEYNADNIKNKLVFVDDSGNTYTYSDGKFVNDNNSFDITLGLSSATNGDISVASGSPITVGSTYQINCTIVSKDENYVLEGTYDSYKNGTLSGTDTFKNSLLLKYKTVQVGNNETLYTIEDALYTAGNNNSNDTIKTVGHKYESTTVTGNVVTSFTSLPRATVGYNDDAYYMLANGDTILLRYSDNDTGLVTLDDKNKKEYTAVYDGSYVYSTLVIPNNVTLDVIGNLYVNGARRNVGNYTSYTEASLGYSELNVEGTITLETSAKFVCYGFAHGDGLIDALGDSTGGATITEPFGMYGWKGGNIALGINSKVFPVNQYTVANIIADLKIHRGAIYNLQGTLSADLKITKAYVDQVITFISPNTSSTFIEMATTTPNGYITKSVDMDTGKVEFEIDADLKFHNISMTVSSYTIKTSDSQVPLNGNFKIVLNSGDAIIPSDVSIKLLPGAELIVGANATLDVQGKAYAYSYQDENPHITYKDSDGKENAYTSWFDGSIATYPLGTNGAEAKKAYRYSYSSTNKKYSVSSIAFGYDAKTSAKVTVAGTLKVSGTIAADICGEEGGEMQFSTSAKLNNIPLQEHQSGGKLIGNDAKYYTATWAHSYGQNGDGNFVELQSGEWIYSKGAWRTQETITINYNANGGSLTGSKSESFTKLTGEEFTVNTINTTNPTRQHYEFTGWYFDQACQNPVSAGRAFTAGVNNSIDVFAGWSPINYIFNYHSVFVGGEANVSIDYSLLPKTFNIESSTVLFDSSLLTAPDGFSFVGFYTDMSCDANYAISELTVEELIKLLNSGSVTIYAQWRPNSVKQFTIDYVNEEDINKALSDVLGTLPTGVELLETDVYDIWMPNGESKDSIFNNINYSHDFLGWFLDGKEITSFQDIVDIYADVETTDTIGITLKAHWEAKINVKASDSVTGYSYDKYHHAQDKITLAEGYTDDNDKPIVPTYFVEWLVNGASVGITDYNGSYTVPAGTGAGTVIKITPKRLDKVNIVFKSTVGGNNNNYSYAGYDKYHMVGDELDYNTIGFDISQFATDPNDHTKRYYFKGWQIDGAGEHYTDSNRYIVQSTDSGIVTFIADVEERTKIQIVISKDGGTAEASFSYTKPSGESQTISHNTSGTYDYYLPVGTSVEYNINVKPNIGSASWSITINGEPLNSASGTFEMPATGGEGVVIKVTTDSCIAEGTLIMMADGTQKPIEDVKPGDKVLVFNHETGKYEEGTMWFIDDMEKEAQMYRVINLEFTDNTVLRIIYKHALFDLDLNTYVYITEQNMKDYIGHRFTNVTYVNGEFVSGEILLTKAFITEETIRVFGPTTEYHLNLVTDSLLTMPSFPYGIEGFINYFEYGEGMKYDEEKMQADIEKYGLFTYEEFAEFMSEEDFNKTPAKYLKVALGKGILTWEEIEWIIEFLYGEGAFTG